MATSHDESGILTLMPDSKRFMFLTIDHVHNTGSMDHKTFGNKGEKFFKHIIQCDYPDTYQILCYSCNQAKRLNKGVCPHNE